MKKIIMTVIMFSICIGLVIGVVIPCANLVKDTGQKSFNSVKNLNNNIKEAP